MTLAFDAPVGDGSLPLHDRDWTVRSGGNGFKLATTTAKGRVETSGNGSYGVIVIWVVEGSVETTVGGARAVAGPGDVVVGSTGTSAFHITSVDATLRMATLDSTLLDRVAAEGTTTAGAVRPSPYLGALVPRNDGAARLWTRTYQHVAETLSEGRETATPLVIVSAGRLLAATALAVFGSAGVGRGAGVLDDEGYVEQPAMLRKAVSYIEAHARFDVGVNDIAAAVYLTPRALQYMFRKHLDVTPMAYLRRVRLEHVHEELVRSNRRTTTVSTTAARWGFAHTGRFAVLYRETYGKSPHITLRE